MAKANAKESQAKKGSKIDIESLNQVLKIMEKGSLIEFLYEEGSLKIQMKKPGAYAVSAAPVYQAAVSAPVPASSAVIAAAPAAAKPAEDNPNLLTIKSPMVGSFYRSPSPDSPPFINIGDMVEPGKTVCIIEAMKIMNEIKSEFKGKVKEILVENAQAVEYNQAIIVLEKA